MLHKFLFTLVCIGRLLSLNAKDIATEMCKQVDDLKLNKSFVFFPLGLSDEELKNLNLIKVEKTSAYCQALDLNLISDELPLFLQSIGNDNPDVIASITQLIFRITNSVKDSQHKESAWLMVLAFVPTDNYDIPRWHIDPFYFLPEEIGRAHV